MEALVMHEYDSTYASNYNPLVHYVIQT